MAWAFLVDPGLFHSVVLTSNGNSYVRLGSEGFPTSATWDSWHSWDVADRVMAMAS